MAWLEPGAPTAPLRAQDTRQGLRPIDLASFSHWAGGYRDPRTDLGLDFEEVELPGPAGATLRGWWVPGAEGATAGLVAVHGAGADRREFLRHVPLFHAQGYPVLLFDCRERGTSDGAVGETRSASREQGRRRRHHLATRRAGSRAWPSSEPSREALR